MVCVDSRAVFMEVEIRQGVCSNSPVEWVIADGIMKVVDLRILF